jgi:hypothetical protein
MALMLPYHPKLWLPTVGWWSRNLIAVTLPDTRLLGSVSTLASATSDTGTPGSCTGAGLVSELLQGASKVSGRPDA